MKKKFFDGLETRRSFLKKSATIGAAGAAALSAPGLLLKSRKADAAKPPTPTVAAILTAICPTALNMIKEKEFYKKAGLSKFKLVNTGTWDPIREGLIAGTFHMVYGGIMEPLIMIDRGMPFTITMGAHKGCIMGACQPEYERGWADLKGKTVGVNVYGSNPYLLSAYHLAAAGLDYKNEVKMKIISAPDMVPAFRQRKIDAVTMWDPVVPVIQELGIPHRVILDINVDMPWRELICCFNMSPTKMVKEHPGTVKRLNQAYIQSARWLEDSMENAKEAVRINIEKHYTPTSLEKFDFQLRLLDSYDFSVAGDPYCCERSIRFFCKTAYEFGAVKHKPDELFKMAYVNYQDLPDEPL